MCACPTLSCTRILRLLVLLLWSLSGSSWAEPRERALFIDCVPRDFRTALWQDGRWQALPKQDRTFLLPAGVQTPCKIQLTRSGYVALELEVDAADLQRGRVPQSLERVITLEPRIVQATFHTQPEGAQIYLQVPPGQWEYLGLSGQPLRLNLAKVTGGSTRGLFVIEMRKAGYDPLQVPVASYSLTADVNSYPSSGALPLAVRKPLPAWLPLLLVPGLAWFWGQRQERTPADIPGAPGPRLGPYVLLQRIASGASATLFKARLADRPVELRALKVIHGYLSDDAAVAQSFAEEAAVLAQLCHPHIVKIYDWGSDLGRPYLVMDWIDGQDVRSALAGEALGWKSACRLLAQAADALAYCHAHGVTHRDVKPENLLVNGAGNLVLVDFGLSRVSAAELCGTPGYVAPELEAGEAAGPASDQYALGIVAWELLTGSLPGPLSLRELRPQLPSELIELVEQMRHPQPAHRYPSLGSVARAFREIASS